MQAAPILQAQAQLWQKESWASMWVKTYSTLKRKQNIHQGTLPRMCSHLMLLQKSVTLPSNQQSHPPISFPRQTFTLAHD